MERKELSYYNKMIGFSESTTPMLDDLEALGCPNVEVVRVGDDIRVAFCKCPTYGDVFDWLMNKGYCIYIAPCSTFASPNHNAWWWELNTYNLDDAYLKKEYSDTDMFYNWGECADAAIKKAIELLKKES